LSKERQSTESEAPRPQAGASRKGNVVLIVPLDPAYMARLAGHLPAKDKDLTPEAQENSFLDRGTRGNEFNQGELNGRKYGTLSKVWEARRVTRCCCNYWKENISSLLSLCYMWRCQS
jgi:hypothetical protein